MGLENFSRGRVVARILTHFENKIVTEFPLNPFKCILGQKQTRMTIYITLLPVGLRDSFTTHQDG
jgi:hypothetical protein